jgi:hypothetical protein
VAAATVSSTIQLSHSTLSPGQSETLSVKARDLVGAPLAGASVTLTVRYGAIVKQYTLHATDSQGRSFLTFTTPSNVKVQAATVKVTISNGFLTIGLTGRFAFRARSGHNPTPAPTPTSTFRASSDLVVIARILPPSVRAPESAWLVVYARSRTGSDRTSAPVTASALFTEGTANVSGLTDSHGVATVRIDTSKVKADQTVAVGVVVRWHGEVGTSASSFKVLAPAKPTPSPTPTRTPTATRTPTKTPGVDAAVITPTWTPVVVATQPSTPSATPLATATMTPIPTPTPTSAPAPTATSTATRTATATPTPTSTPTPTATNTQVPNCPGSQSACRQALLNVLNQDRQTWSAAQSLNLRPLTLNGAESDGSGGCPGSIGHSQAMAQSGTIWHYNPNYPAASFPNDICVHFSTAGENVGEWSSGNELQDLMNLDAAMMSEPHSAGCLGNHACNILGALYSSVGIGIFVDSRGTTWLTEDFIG